MTIDAVFDYAMLTGSLVYWVCRRWKPIRSHRRGRNSLQRIKL